MLKIDSILALSIIILLTLGSIYLFSNDNKEVIDPIGGPDRPYYFRVELYQGLIVIRDLNGIEDLMLAGTSRNIAFQQSTYTNSLGRLEKNSQVYFQLYSLDIPHDFSINELDIHIPVLKITKNIDKTIPVYYDLRLPDQDTSFTAYCGINSGDSHSNMQIKMVVGNVESSNGNLILDIFILLNAMIVILFVIFFSKQKNLRSAN